MAEQMTIADVEAKYPIQFEARGLNKLKNHLENIKSEMPVSYASNEVYLLSLGDTILANIDNMPALLQELAEYGEICSQDNNTAISCINGVYYIDMAGRKIPAEYNTPEIAIARFIDALNGDYAKC